MEQQQYQYHPTDEPTNRTLRPGNRFLRLWSPVIIKWGIAFLITMLAMTVYEMSFILKENGMTFASLQNPQMLNRFMDIIHQYVIEPSKITELTNTISVDFMKYATPVEGLAALITIPILGFMFHKDSLEQKIIGFVENRKAPLYKYGSVLVMSAAMTIGVNNLIAISGISNASEGYEETMTAFYSSDFLVQILCLGILIPICEELVFRGLMFRRLRQLGKFMPAMLYSSLVFAFMHMNLVQMLYAFFLGALFCYMYEKFGSVKAPIAAHMTANIISVIFTRVQALDWLYERPMFMGVITVLCASISATAYLFMKSIDETPENGIKEQVNIGD